MELTELQVAYLAGQRLGRLATIGPDGTPQNNPVGFGYNHDLGTIDIGGHNMERSRKFRNLATHPKVAFVVDDIASVRPWRVRCLEIRGHAEAIIDPDSSRANIGGPLIRIHPDRILSFGLHQPAGPPT